MHILDNECSSEFKNAIKENEMSYQLVLPHDHRRNVAEKAIQTFKHHFVSVLCGADDDFPLQLWCQCGDLFCYMKLLDNSLAIADRTVEQEYRQQRAFGLRWSSEQYFNT